MAKSKIIDAMRDGPTSERWAKGDLQWTRESYIGPEGERGTAVHAKVKRKAVLDSLFERGSITSRQYAAGCHYLSTHERARIGGTPAVGGLERIDGGGRSQEPYAVFKAREDIYEIHTNLGMTKAWLVERVIVHGDTLSAAADHCAWAPLGVQRFGSTSASKWFKEALDLMANFYLGPEKVRHTIVGYCA